MNKIANPFVCFILRSPLHGWLSATVLLISYTGKKSGKQYTLPVQYTQAGQTIYILPGMPTQKTWWRNLRGGAPVTLMLKGKSLGGMALVLEKQPEKAAEALRQYLKRFPPAAKLHAIRIQADGTFTPDDLQRAARSTLVVQVNLGQSAAEFLPSR